MPGANPLRSLAEQARRAEASVDFLLRDLGESLRQTELPARLGDALAVLKAVFAGCDDVVFREFRVGGRQPVAAALIYTDGLVSSTTLHQEILKPLMFQARLDAARPDLFRQARDLAVAVGDVKEAADVRKLASAVLDGEAALLLDGSPRALLLGTRGGDKRAIEKPEHKAVIRGPKDSFTEELRLNTALLRRRLHDPQVKVMTLKVGRVTRTRVALVFHQRIADPALVAEVRRRIEAVDVDGILDSGKLEQLISDHPRSIFPTVQESERPDETAAAILEGRVAIVVDNTPFVLLVPATLNNLMITPEDYYTRWSVATILRLVRYTAMVLTLTLPALYVALTSFRPEVIPVELGVFIAGSREGRPFPVFEEILIMEVALELLREATIRLPGTFGQAISVVGTLVVGQAAVRAGLVSALVIIVSGVTAVASFAMPAVTFGFAVRLLRFPVMFAAAIFGLTGMIIALYVILVHLAILKSFNLEYLAPYGPVYRRDLGDTIVRLPWRLLARRPREYHPREAARGPDRGPR